MSRFCAYLFVAIVAFLVAAKWNDHVRFLRYGPKIPYRILHGSQNTTPEEFEEEYRWQVRNYHPDVNPDCDTCEIRMRYVVSAYETVMYDRTLIFFHIFHTAPPAELVEIAKRDGKRVADSVPIKWNRLLEDKQEAYRLFYRLARMAVQRLLPMTDEMVSWAKS